MWTVGVIERRRARVVHEGSLPEAQVSAQSGVQPGRRGLGSREQPTRARLSTPPTPERAGGASVDKPRSIMGRLSLG